VRPRQRLGAQFRLDAVVARRSGVDRGDDAARIDEADLEIAV